MIYYQFCADIILSQETNTLKTKLNIFNENLTKINEKLVQFSVYNTYFNEMLCLYKKNSH